MPTEPGTPTPDLVALRARLGIPTQGKLDREQSLVLLRALWGEPPAEGVAWARKALGLAPVRSA